MEEAVVAFLIKGIPNNFTNFTGKHLCWGLFFNPCVIHWSCRILRMSKLSRCVWLWPPMFERKIDTNFLCIILSMPNFITVSAFFNKQQISNVTILSMSPSYKFWCIKTLKEKILCLAFMDVILVSLLLTLNILHTLLRCFNDMMFPML